MKDAVGDTELFIYITIVCVFAAMECCTMHYIRTTTKTALFLSLEGEVTTQAS